MRTRELVIWAVAALAVMVAARALRPASPSADSRPHAPLARALPRGRAQLPRGIRVIPEPHGFLARRDVLAGELALPTGRLAIDDFYLGDPQLTLDVPPGRHAVRITWADSVRYGARGAAVALATLITGPGPPVHWRFAGSMGTDGGTGGFASLEAAKRMAGGEAESDRLLEVADAGRENGVGEMTFGRGLNLFTFPTGLGDGGYGVYVGTDRRGRVVRVVMDCGLLHLAWPS
jgi:hypothetical protein